MVRRRNFSVDRANQSIRPDDECRAFRAHVFFPIHAFLNPDAVGLDDGAGLVAEKRKGQLVLRDELRVARGRVDAHAINQRSLGEDASVVVAHAAGLRGASGCVVFRVEIEDDAFTMKAGEAYGLAFSAGSAHCGGVESWSDIAGLQGVFHGLKNFTRVLCAQAAAVVFFDCWQWSSGAVVIYWNDWRAALILAWRDFATVSKTPQKTPRNFF